MFAHIVSHLELLLRILSETWGLDFWAGGLLVQTSVFLLAFGRPDFQHFPDRWKCSKINVDGVIFCKPVENRRNLVGNCLENVSLNVKIIAVSSENHEEKCVELYALDPF